MYHAALVSLPGERRPNIPIKPYILRRHLKFFVGTFVIFLITGKAAKPRETHIFGKCGCGVWGTPGISGRVEGLRGGRFQNFENFGAVTTNTPPSGRFFAPSKNLEHFRTKRVPSDNFGGWARRVP